MGISRFFPKKEITEENKKQREYIKNMKYVKKQFDKSNILKDEFKEKSYYLIDNNINDKEKIREEKQKVDKLILEKQYDTEFKRLKKKFYKNPLKVTKFMDDAFNLMDRAVKDGVMSEKEREKTLNQINKDMEKMQKITGVLRK